MTNRLSTSLSPYLRQHAENPVDWWPWGAAAFDEARRRDVPVFLSVGYAACHWCHVMAHESFDDPEVAAVLNSRFVSVKVDREEHPDVDATYMRATTALTGRGGWPMSVWLDHSGRAFYAGTYFPPRPRLGMPSFGSVLDAVSRAWTERRDQVEGAADRIAQALAVDRRPPDLLDPASIDLAQVTSAAVTALESEFDRAQGGFGGAPKFPPTMVVDFLLRAYAAGGDGAALTMAEATLEAMARGGIYDQLGGGFARYSVDADWIVPHFEKMLYDNAGLLADYTYWWRIGAGQLARRVAAETAEFMLSELGTDEGGFASSLDADSLPDQSADVAEEGAYYTWRRAEILEILGDTDGPWFADLCGVTAEGTFEQGRSTLQLRTDPPDWVRFERLRRRLLDARGSRPLPTRDDKVVAAWNGLAITALVEAGMVFDRPEWVAAAERAGRLLADVHLRADDRLLRVSRQGTVGDAPGVLEDYAHVAQGFLALYQATSNLTWFSRAQQLLAAMIHRFDDGHGGLWDAVPGPLLPPQRDDSDNAYPAGGSAAATALLTFAALGGDLPGAGPDARELVLTLLARAVPLMQRQPRFAGTWLATAVAVTSGPIEVAIAASDSS
ncbi:MAG: thioredoxin domain-containing protein, partial [Actinobacteria bacterium]|nr:thioredoxin domain-containing protein [Actinomycetota bacterium]